MSGAACEAARAEVIRWNESEGQGDGIELAALDTAVLRYDGQGKLIVPARSEPEEITRKGETTEVSYATRGVAAPAEVLPRRLEVSSRPGRRMTSWLPLSGWC